eukprot:178484-Heterocapsa_arctica.AAC.1
MSSWSSRARSRCLAPPLARFMRCQLLPAVQGMDAITCLPGNLWQSEIASSRVDRRRKSPTAV